jgi:hypothetical protein
MHAHPANSIAITCGMISVVVLEVPPALLRGPYRPPPQHDEN